MEGASQGPRPWVGRGCMEGASRSHLYWFSPSTIKHLMGGFLQSVAVRGREQASFLLTLLVSSSDDL